MSLPRTRRRQWWTHARIPAARSARVMHHRPPSPSKEGAGNAGCWPHPRTLRAKEVHFAHASDTGQPEHPAFPARWLYGLYVVSSVRRASWPPSPSQNVLRALDPSIGRSGPHDFAVRLRHVRLTRHRRPSHPRLTVRDDRPKRPSSSRRDGRDCRGDLPDGASEKICGRLARRAIWAWRACGICRLSRCRLQSGLLPEFV
jgi:hypothetical protein